MKKTKIKTHCPICRKEFVSKPKFLRGDLIQHFWGIHKMDGARAHANASHFIRTGKLLEEAAHETDLPQL